MANKPKRQSAPARTRPVSNEELALLRAQAQANEQRWKTAKYAVGILGACLLVLASYPVASLFAGEVTIISIQVALTLTITLAVTEAATAAIAVLKHKGEKKQRDRARELSRDVKELQKRLRDLGQDDSVSR